MITTDLKLLVNVAWANRNGQVDYRLASGEYSAVDRLVKKGLLMSGGGGLVGITASGEKLVEQFCSKIKRVRGVK